MIERFAKHANHKEHYSITLFSARTTKNSIFLYQYGNFLNTTEK